MYFCVKYYPKKAEEIMTYTSPKNTNTFGLLLPQESLRQKSESSITTPIVSIKRKLSADNIEKEQLESNYKNVIPKMITIKRGFTIGPAQNSESSSSKGISPNSLGQNSGRSRQPSLKKTQTATVQLSARHLMESIVESEENEDIPPNVTVEQRIDSSSHLSLPRTPRIMSTFKKLALKSTKDGRDILENSREIPGAQSQKSQNMRICGITRKNKQTGAMQNVKVQGSEDSKYDSARVLDSSDSSRESLISDKFVINNIQQQREHAEKMQSEMKIIDVGRIDEINEKNIMKENDKMVKCEQDIGETEKNIEKMGEELDKKERKINEKLKELYDLANQIKEQKRATLQFNVINNVNMRKTSGQ